MQESFKRARRDESGAVHELVVPLIDAFGRFVHGLVLNEPALAPFASLFLDAWGMNAYTAHIFVPAMHPASICRADIGRLHRETFLASRKTDGVRVQLVMYAAGGRSYVALIDRQFRTHVFSRERLRASPAGDWIAATRLPDGCLGSETVTVIDAELVTDAELVHETDDNDDDAAAAAAIGRDPAVRRSTRATTHQRPTTHAVHRARPTLVCHDAVCLLGVSLINTGFETRIRALNSFVDRVLRSRTDGPLALLDVRVKPWYSSVAACMEATESNARQPTTLDDGFILAAANGTLRNGIASQMYKWKRVHTVDLFCLARRQIGAAAAAEDDGVQTDCADRPRLYVTDGPRPVKLDAAALGDDVRVDEDSFRALLNTTTNTTNTTTTPEPDEIDYNTLVARSKIVESVFVVAAPGSTHAIVLRALKVRTDKPLGNDLRVVRRTLLNVRENITLQEIGGLRDATDDAVVAVHNAAGAAADDDDDDV